MPFDETMKSAEEGQETGGTPESSVKDNLAYNEKVENGLHGKKGSEVTNPFSENGVEHSKFISGTNGNEIKVDTTNAELKNDATEGLRKKAQIEKSANQKYAEAERDLQNVDTEADELNSNFENNSAQLESGRTTEMNEVASAEKTLNENTFAGIQGILKGEEPEETISTVA